MAPCVADEWIAAHASAREIHAARFRWESAAALAPQRDRLRRIAVEGIATPEDLDLARTAAAILAADVYLLDGGDEYE
jgi:hypothetical protein